MELTLCLEVMNYFVVLVWERVTYLLLLMLKCNLVVDVVVVVVVVMSSTTNY
jgi:hypothetical protein